MHNDLKREQNELREALHALCIKHTTTKEKTKVYPSTNPPPTLLNRLLPNIKISARSILYSSRPPPRRFFIYQRPGKDFDKRLQDMSAVDAPAAIESFEPICILPPLASPPLPQLPPRGDPTPSIYSLECRYFTYSKSLVVSVSRAVLYISKMSFSL